jgi:hypothetical protein
MLALALAVMPFRSPSYVALNVGLDRNYSSRAA